MINFGIVIEEIAQLGTQIATSGAIRVAEAARDDVFEHIIAVAVLIYQTG